MRYATASAFRAALDERLKTECAKTGLSITRLRKRVAFELFLRRLVQCTSDPVQNCTGDPVHDQSPRDSVGV